VGVRAGRYLQSTLVALGVLLTVVLAEGQTQPVQQPSQAEDVIRINTELVQTDVTVFDKKGRFVDGLKAEQFALKVDHKPQTISFFERVSSGRTNAEKTAPGNSGANSNDPSTSTATIRGRTVIFFVDDLHLAPDSLSRTRDALLQFIDHGMLEKDQVAITSASGQIGFLQQFTDDRTALRTAVARLNYKANPKLDMENPPMSEYIALKIREGDEQAMQYYVQEMQKQYCWKGSGSVICTMSPQGMRAAVRERAQEMMTMSAPATDNTLITLENLMRMAAQLPGRKIVFMISDGFYLSDRKMGAIDRIRRIADAGVAPAS
jgi:VWFA-related protein